MMISNTPLHIESVWTYPRPPVIEEVPQTVIVIFNGQVIVDCQRAKRVLETSHPPVYYIPIEEIKSGVLQPVSGDSWCEWKGKACYYDVVLNGRTAEKAAWYYPNPVPKFVQIKNYVAFYAAKMDACFVEDEKVLAQEGGFYGGWITSNLIGPFKGGPIKPGW
jgi:uncharacterized protein (DUF427 family)